MCSEIVGPETMEKLQNINITIQTENNTEEFYILHRLFENLKRNANYYLSNESPSVLSENLESNSDSMPTS